MKAEIISRETIKPFSPTPPDLRSHSLTLFDQLSPNIYVPIVFFYRNHQLGVDISNHLKKSLSETLARYYPFAGRIRDRVSIDCNDEGVVFLEAKIKFKLLEILENPKYEALDLLFPESNLNSSLLAVQISYFDCGGIAIGLCISHKIGDAATMVTFINDWATLARNPDEQVSPLFNAASVFPSGGLSILPETVLAKGNCDSRRYVFCASKIASLKAMVGEKVKNPTRVEVVTALVYKCAVSAGRLSSGSVKPTLLIQSLNIRKRVAPPLPENTIGNMVWYFTASTKESDDVHIELHRLVGQMKENMGKFCRNYAEKLRGEEWFSLIMECLQESGKMFVSDGNQVVYRCSSWCNFPVYDADFGWGKPVWVTIGRSISMPKNTIVLMDTRNGDGIEVFVNLEEEDMALFERDAELLGFASFNPSALASDLEPL